MTSRPAYRKLLRELHNYEPDAETDGTTCAFRDSEGRPCRLPENNRHHKTQPITDPAQPAEQPAQLRLDIDG